MDISEIKNLLISLEYKIKCNGLKVDDKNLMYYCCLYGYYASKCNIDSISKRLANIGVITRENISTYGEELKHVERYSQMACSYFKTGRSNCSNKCFILSCIAINRMISQSDKDMVCGIHQVFKFYDISGR